MFGAPIYSHNYCVEKFQELEEKISLNRESAETKRLLEKGRMLAQKQQSRYVEDKGTTAQIPREQNIKQVLGIIYRQTNYVDPIMNLTAADIERFIENSSEFPINIKSIRVEPGYRIQLEQRFGNTVSTVNITQTQADVNYSNVSVTLKMI